jgi:hypothetical protein
LLKNGKDAPVARRNSRRQDDTPNLFDSLIIAADRHADRFAEELRLAAERAQNEQDIRVAVERELGQPFGQRLRSPLAGSGVSSAAIVRQTRANAWWGQRQLAASLPH